MSKISFLELVEGQRGLLGIGFAAFLDFEEAFPGREVEEAGVGGGGVGEQEAYGKVDEGGYPHADGAHGSFADRFLAYHADDVVHNEESYRGYERHTKTAFADDGAEGCSDEEEEKAGYGEGEFAHPFDVVAVDVFLVGFDEGVVHLHVAEGVEGGGSGLGEVFLTGSVEGVSNQLEDVGVGGSIAWRSSGLVAAHFVVHGVFEFAVAVAELGFEFVHRGVELRHVHHLDTSVEEVVVAFAEGEGGDVEGEHLFFKADVGEGAREVVFAV